MRRNEFNSYITEKNFNGFFIELTPDNMTSSLPSYGQMYPQEIQELIRRRFD